MNKKLGIILLVLSIITLLLFYFKGRPGNDGGFDLSDRAFKLENPQSIDKISILRKNYPLIVFTKKNDVWYLSNGKEAQQESILGILNLMKKMTLSFIPNKAMTSTIKNSINKNGILVKMYDGNDQVSSYYVGSDLNSQGTTAFLMEGKDQPYAMESIGFVGSIRTRFEFDMNEYETKTILKENLENIEEVSVIYPQDRPSSFVLKKENNEYVMTNPYSQAILPNLNQKLIEPYLQTLETLYAEYNDANNENREDILKSKKFCEFTLKRKDGSMKKLDYYLHANITDNTGLYSPKDPILPESRYSILTSDGQFFLGQHRVVGKLLLPFDSFSKK